MRSEMAEYLRFSLDIKVYSLDSVKRAAFDLCNDAYFKFTSNENEQIMIDVKLKEGASPNTIDNFFNKILDHQLRIDLASQFGTLREIIVAQAFAPCDNLNELLEFQDQRNNV